MKKIGPYTVERELSRGGMGVVYRARDPQLDRPVAIKVLLPAGFGMDQLDWARFQLEARTTARLRHPNVIAIHSAGQADGRPYLVLDLIEGGSLHERIQSQGPLPCREAAQIARTLADALHHAHEEGILHRDLKPQNVLLEGGTKPLLADFGLGKLMGVERAGFTATGEVLGTPAYMSPEQASAEHGQVGQATDVYGLGATLYAMLTGRAPFKEKSLVNTLDSVRHRPPLAPSQLRPELDLELEAICLRCLAKSPADRYPSAAALRDALDKYLAAGPAAAPPAPARRRLHALGLVLCGVLVGGASGAWASQGTSSPQLEGEAARLNRRALQRSNRSDFEGAEQDWSEVLELEPQAASIWFERAGARLGREDFAGALADLDRVASFEPADPEAVHFVRSKVYCAMEDYPQALAEADRALALRPDNALYALQRGLAKEKLGDGEGALVDFARALELDPRLAGSHFRRSCVYVERGDYEETLREVAAALALEPDYAPALAVRGMVLAKQGDHPGSLIAFRAALQPSLEELTEHLCNRASALLQLEDWDAAAVDSGLALEANPEWKEASLLHGVARRGQAFLHQRAGRPELARRLYQEALRAFQTTLELTQDEDERRAMREQIGGLDASIRDLDRGR